MKGKHYLAIILATILLYPIRSRSYAKDKAPALPVIILPVSNTNRSDLVLIISGDGGWNTFCSQLAQHYLKAGIPVVGLNSFKYFWDKKTPQQASEDIAGLLLQYSRQWNKKNIILCGYSFGADVMPFIYQGLPEAIKEEVCLIQLLSPASYTDFEIHISDLLGSENIIRKLDVAHQVKQITKPIVCFYGVLEKEKPLKNIQLGNYKAIILKGDHHYDHIYSPIIATVSK